jgi:hypothetical protein
MKVIYVSHQNNDFLFKHFLGDHLECVQFKNSITNPNQELNLDLKHIAVGFAKAGWLNIDIGIGNELDQARQTIIEALGPNQANPAAQNVELDEYGDPTIPADFGEPPEPAEIFQAMPLLLFDAGVDGNNITWQETSRILIDPCQLSSVSELKTWTSRANPQFKGVCLGHQYQMTQGGDNTNRILGSILHRRIQDYVRTQNADNVGLENPVAVRNTDEYLREYFQSDPKERLSFSVNNFNGQREKVDMALNRPGNVLNDYSDCEKPFLSLKTGWEGRADLVSNNKVADIKLSNQSYETNNQNNENYSQMVLYGDALNKTNTSLLSPIPDDEHTLLDNAGRIDNVVTFQNAGRIKAFRSDLAAHRFGERENQLIQDNNNNTIRFPSGATFSLPMNCELTPIDNPAPVYLKYAAYLHQMNERQRWIARHQWYNIFHRPLKTLVERHLCARKLRFSRVIEDRSWEFNVSNSTQNLNDLTDLDVGSMVELYKYPLNGGQYIDHLLPNEVLTPYYGIITNKNINPEGNGTTEYTYTVIPDEYGRDNPPTQNPNMNWVMQARYIGASFDRHSEGISSFINDHRTAWLDQILTTQTAPAAIPEWDTVRQSWTDILNSLNHNLRPDETKKAICDNILTNNFPVNLLVGPPGTGKTFVIALLAFVYAKAGKKVRISTMTRNAAGNILKEMKNVWQEGQISGLFNNNPQLSRIAMWAGKDKELDEFTTDGFNEFKLSQILQLADQNNVNPWGADDQFKNNFKNGIKILIGTNLSCFQHPVTEQWTPNDVVSIIDEASQLTECGSLLSLLKCNRVIMVGDPKQISPIVPENDGIPIDAQGQTAVGYKMNCEWQALQDINITHFSESLFERLLRIDQIPRETLTQVFRTQYSDLVTLHSELYYDGVLSVNELTVPEEPVFHIHHVAREAGVSPRESEAHANYIRDNILNLLNNQNLNWAILVPFNAQRALLQRTLPEYRNRIFTIDSYQGREADYIIFNVSASKGALRNCIRLKKIGDKIVDSKLNVAISRAKKQFHFVGDWGILSSDIIDLKLPDWAGNDDNQTIESPYKSLYHKLIDLGSSQAMNVSWNGFGLSNLGVEAQQISQQIRNERQQQPNIQNRFDTVLGEINQSGLRDLQTEEKEWIADAITYIDNHAPQPGDGIPRYIAAISPFAVGLEMILCRLGIHNNTAECNQLAQIDRNGNRVINGSIPLLRFDLNNITLGVLSHITTIRTNLLRRVNVPEGHPFYAICKDGTDGNLKNEIQKITRLRNISSHTPQNLNDVGRYERALEDFKRYFAVDPDGFLNKFFNAFQKPA